MRTTLQFERLEDRNLAAQYLFTLDVLENLDGEVGAPLDQVEVGEPFWLQLTVQDLRPGPQGIQGAGVKMRFDTEALQVRDIVLTEAWPILNREIVTDAGAEILATSFVGLGAGRYVATDGEPEEIARLLVEATQPGEIGIRAYGGSGIGFVPAERYRNEDVIFERETICAVDSGDPETLTCAVEPPVGGVA